MQKDELSHTSVYQRAFKEGYDEGLEKGREEARKILQQQLQRQRESLFDVMLKRYPHLAHATKDYAETIDNSADLLRLTIRMATIPTAVGAEILLQIMVEESKETD
ncbi:MAG: hypothetical protein ABI406_02100 [Ktedonobacteraceae bacterium]